MNLKHDSYDDDDSLIDYELNKVDKQLGIDTQDYKKLPVQAKMDNLEKTVNGMTKTNDQRRSDQI